MMISKFTRKKLRVDALVLIVGHQNPDFLMDTIESFDHHNRDTRHSYLTAYAVDNNKDCAQVISSRTNPDLVYYSKSKNGWGRGIMRTIAYALDQFRRNGYQWDHLITIDSDTLIVGPCLDNYLDEIEPGVCFVGQKWGGEGPYTPFNPGPTEVSKRQIRQLAKLGILPEGEWNLPDYMVAGPYMVWTRECQNFMEKCGLLPGSAFDQYYPYVSFPHDQMSTFVLGYQGNQFREIGPASYLYCGDVGGEDDWKSGIPIKTMLPYGKVPVHPEYASVIHPIRTKVFEEGKVRAFYRKIRQGQLPKESAYLD